MIIEKGKLLLIKMMKKKLNQRQKLKGREGQNLYKEQNKQRKKLKMIVILRKR